MFLRTRTQSTPNLNTHTHTHTHTHTGSTAELRKSSIEISTQQQQTRRSTQDLKSPTDPEWITNTTASICRTRTQSPSVSHQKGSVSLSSQVTGQRVRAPHNRRWEGCSPRYNNSVNKHTATNTNNTAESGAIGMLPKQIQTTCTCYKSAFV